MLYIVYHNQTKFITYTRLDLATPAPSPAEVWFADFVDNHNAVAAEHTIVVHPNNNVSILLGRDKYDPDTNTVFADPNWVAPVSTPVTPTEPAA